MYKNKRSSEAKCNVEDVRTGWLDTGIDTGPGMTKNLDIITLDMTSDAAAHGDGRTWLNYKFNLRLARKVSGNENGER